MASTLWDPATGKEIWHFGMSGTDDSRAIQFSHNGKVLGLVAGSDARLIDARSGTQVRQWQALGDQKLAFSPDDAIVAIAGSRVKSDDKSLIQLWNVETGELIRELPGHTHFTNSLDFSPNGKILASGGHDNRVRLWELQTGKELHVYPGHEEMVTGVAYSPDSQFIGSSSFDGHLLVWQWKANNLVQSHRDTHEQLEADNYSPDGKLLAVGSSDALVRLYETSGNSKFTLRVHDSQCRIFALAFHPAAKVLASSSIDSTIRLWDVTSRKEIRRLEGGAQWKWVRSLAFAPDGKTLASGREYGEIRSVDWETGRLLRTFAASGNEVASIAFRPDGQSLASADRDGSIVLMDALNGRPMVRYRARGGQHHCIAFSPDGWFLVSGEADGEVMEVCNASILPWLPSLSFVDVLPLP